MGMGWVENQVRIIVTLKIMAKEGKIIYQLQKIKIKNIYFSSYHNIDDEFN